MKKTLVAFAVAACAGAAFAADVPTTYNPVEYKQYGNSYTWRPLNGPTPSSGGGVVFRGSAGISDATPKISTVGQLPFDKRPSIADAQKAVVSSPFTKANFGKALMFAGRVAWPIGVAISAGEIYDYLTQEKFSNIRNTSNGVTADYQDDGLQYEYYFSSYGPYPTGAAACGKILQLQTQNGNPYNISFSFQHPSTCIRSDGTAYELSYSSRPYTEVKPLNEQEIVDRIAASPAWNQAAAKALADAIGKGATVQTETPSVSGPSSIPGESSTKTESVRLKPGTNTPAAPGEPSEPGTQTTTSQTSTNVTYNTNAATTNTVNNTSTSITNNITNVTTSEGNKTTETTNPQQPQEPQEIKVCGLPNTPPCKIDEKGTPEPKEDKAADDIDKAKKPLDDFLKNPTSALPTFPTINWAFTLPSGCSPIALPAFAPYLQEIDVCAFQPMFHDLMSFVWVMGGIFGAIGTFWRNTFSQS